jgi:Tfp pilus assembly protein PilV
MNSKNLKQGQFLIELIIAIALFATVILGLSLFIFDSYNASRLALDMTKADFLAEEGLEAAKSIRDNKFSDLSAGSHGLVISSGHWIFQGIEDDITSQLNGGKRVVVIENDSLDQNIKKVTSTVTWKFTENRSEEVKLISYLTNWQKGIEIRKPTARTDSGGHTTNDNRAYDYPDGTTFATTRFDFNSNPSITFHTWQVPTQVYTSLVLKYRYHADEGANGRYAVAYSLNGCNGTFNDLIPLTSSAAPDSTVSVDLPSSQNLSLLCIKIYTQRISGGPNRNLYTRDIWTEGTY